MNSFQGAHKKGALFFFVSRFAVEKLSGAIIVSERKKERFPTNRFLTKGNMDLPVKHYTQKPEAWRDGEAILYDGTNASQITKWSNGAVRKTKGSDMQFYCDSAARVLFLHLGAYIFKYDDPKRGFDIMENDGDGRLSSGATKMVEGKAA
jgi:hypothetical protein